MKKNTEKKLKVQVTKESTHEISSAVKYATEADIDRVFSVMGSSRDYLQDQITGTRRRFAIRLEEANGKIGLLKFWVVVDTVAILGLIAWIIAA